MIDKPIPAKILLKLASSTVQPNEFLGLYGTLYRQNLVFANPKELRINNDTLELIVVFRDKNSFSNWLKNEEIKAYWLPRFELQLSGLPQTVKETDVIIELDGIKNCSCGKSEFYLLQGRSLPYAEELVCNNCLGLVSYSKIPVDIDLEFWQTNYERFYMNWLESDMFEKEALKELTNFKGKLNTYGEKIRKQLAEHFGLPVYMRYFTEDPREDNTCPICGFEGEKSGMRKPSRVCKKCNTIFNYSED